MPTTLSELSALSIMQLVLPMLPRDKNVSGIRCSIANDDPILWVHVTVTHERREHLVLTFKGDKETPVDTMLDNFTDTLTGIYNSRPKAI